MTEAEWNACTDPDAMLEFRPKRASNRKRRLFACACCRRIWHFIPTELSHGAVEVAERYVDGLATKQERDNIWASAFASAEEEGILTDEYSSELVGWGCIPGGLAFNAAVEVVSDAEAAVIALDARAEVAADAFRMWHGEESSEHALAAADAAEKKAQSILLRDVLGNPFHPVTIHPTWLTPTVPALAQAAYDNRILPAGTLDNTRLAILANALEDAGASGALLEH
jgi:hypothetical protein